MPEEWWSRHDSGDLCRLIENLYQRRSAIRDLITAFRNSTRNPFPNWASKLAGPKFQNIRARTTALSSLPNNLSRGVQAAPIVLLWP
jgi:hypothetical protein